MNQKGYARYLVHCGLIAYDRGERFEAYDLLRKGHRAWKRGDPSWINAHAVENMKSALTELSKAPPPTSAELPPE